MKTITQLSSLVLLVWFCAGCATILPGNDQLVVRAEQTRSIALDTFDVFLKFEYTNREYLFSANPAIKHYADYVRKNEKIWLDTLDNAIQTYKANRTTENKATVVTWLAVVERAMADAQTFFVTSQKSL